MMELEGNIWDFYPTHRNWPGVQFIPVIPINTTLKKDGTLVMGRGLAAQAKHKLPGVSITLGAYIRAHPKQMFYCFSPPNGIGDDNMLMGFGVTKLDWRAPSTANLVAKTCKQILSTIQYIRRERAFLLPRLGCGLGGLNWETDVKPIYRAIFGDNPQIYVINNPLRVVK